MYYYYYNKTIDAANRYTFDSLNKGTNERVF